MSEDSELQAEVERLREHNEKLLAELKQAKASATAAANGRDELAADIKARDEAPMMAAFEDMASNSHVSGYLRTEFEKHFTVGSDDDGFTIQDADGEPFKIDGRMARLEYNDVRQLVERDNIAALRPLMRASGATGGGAKGNQSGAPAFNKPEPEPERPRFGLK